MQSQDNKVIIFIKEFCFDKKQKQKHEDPNYLPNSTQTLLVENLASLYTLVT